MNAEKVAPVPRFHIWLPDLKNNTDKVLIWNHYHPLSQKVLIWNSPHTPASDKFRARIACFRISMDKATPCRIEMWLRLAFPGKTRQD
jgi:hypothetical protein